MVTNGMTIEELKKAHDCGVLNDKGKSILIDCLRNPDARDFKQEQADSMKITDHDIDKHKPYRERFNKHKEVKNGN